MSRVTPIRDKNKGKYGKKMEKGRPLGMKCILMPYREGETLKRCFRGSRRGKIKIQNEKSGRSWF